MSDEILFNEEAIKAIEDIFSRWVPGTWENGYAMAEYLRRKGQEIYDATADDESMD